MSKKTETLHPAALAALLIIALFALVAIGYAKGTDAQGLPTGTTIMSSTPTSTSTAIGTPTQLPMTNDYIEYATNITALPYTVSQPLAQTTRSASDPQPRCWSTYFTNTIWYQYTPAVSQRVMFDAVKSDFATNPGLAIFTGIPGGLVERGCSRYANSQGIDLTLTAGTTYYIMGAMYGWTPATTQQFTLNVDVVPVVPNDDFANAIQITSLPFSFQQNIYASTKSASDPAVSCGSYFSYQTYNNSVWYQYTASTDQTIALSARGSEFGATIAVYTGSQSSLTEQSCYYAGANTFATFSAHAGVQYSIMIAKDNSDPLQIFSELVLSSFAIDPVPNDDFASATLVPGLPFDETIDVYGATSAPTDPKLREYCLYSQSQAYPNTVWYRYVPATDHTLNISTDGSSYRTIMGVYTLGGSNLSEYACSGDTYLSIGVHAGITYYVMIASADNTDRAPLEHSSPLHVRFDLPPVSNDLFQDATIVNSFPFAVEQNIYGSTLSPNDPTGCTTNFQSNSVWFKYTPAQNQAVLLDVTSSDYDAAVKVYTQGEGDLLVERECAFGSVGMQAQAGTTYFIMVSRIQSSSAPPLQPTDQLRFRITAPLVSNDLVESPIIIPSDEIPYSNTQDIFGSSITMNDLKLTTGNCRSSDTYSLNRPNTVWYQYTAATTQTLVIDTRDSDYPAYVELPNQGICGYGVRTFQAQAGTTYLIKVAYNNPPDGRPVSQPTLLRLTLRPAIANDIQADALLVNTTPFTYTENVTDATANSSEPYSTGCGTYTQSVWFKYVPDADHTVLIDTSGSNYDAIIGLYRNSFYSGCVSSEPAQFTLNARAGSIYYIVIMNRSLSQTPAPAPVILQFSITDTTNSHLIDNARIIPSTALTYHDAQDLGKGPGEFPPPYTICSALPSSGFQNVIWYRYTPIIDMQVSVTNRVTHGENVANVYTVGNGYPIGCDLGWNGHPATVNFYAFAGESYYIMIGEESHTVSGDDPWLNHLIFTASVIAQPIPLTPNAVVATTRPLFTWTPTLGSENYELTLTPDGDVASTFIIDAANCTSTLCSYTLDDDLALGQYQWSVRGWNSQLGYTLSSWTLPFEVISNTPPTISDVNDQQTSINTPTDAIPFTIGDTETGATELTLTVSSSNTALVPNSNIVFGGSGTIRSVTITPAANQIGTTIITITVHDANDGTASDTFLLTVNSGPPALLHFESDASEIIRTGGWKQQTRPSGASGGSYLINTASDDTFFLYFIGTRADIFYVGGPAFGQIVVEVDEVVNQVVTSTAFDYTFNRSIVIAGLANGAHTLRIRAIGVIGIDAFDIISTSQAILPPVMFPQLEPTIPPPGLPLPALPPPLTLPIYATMDDGAPDWKASAGWTLQTQAAYGGSGLGWQTSAADSSEVLRWGRQLDLRSISPDQMVQLTFQSLLTASQSSATVQISTDGINWTPLSQIAPSGGWNSVTVDVSAYRGQLIQVQFVWQGAAPSEGQPPDSWSVDNVSVEAATPPVGEPPVPTIIPPPTAEVTPDPQPPEAPVPLAS